MQGLCRGCKGILWVVGLVGTGGMDKSLYHDSRPYVSILSTDNTRTSYHNPSNKNNSHSSNSSNNSNTGNNGNNSNDNNKNKKWNKAGCPTRHEWSVHTPVSKAKQCNAGESWGNPLACRTFTCKSDVWRRKPHYSYLWLQWSHEVSCKLVHLGQLHMLPIPDPQASASMLSTA